MLDAAGDGLRDEVEDGVLDGLSERDVAAAGGRRRRGCWRSALQEGYEKDGSGDEQCRNRAGSEGP